MRKKRINNRDIVTQLADFFMPTTVEEAKVVSGRTYAFAVTDNEVNITFPHGLDKLGGLKQTARLEGRLELFIEDAQEDRDEARIWIVDIKETIYDLNVFGMEAYTLDMAMLDYAGFDHNNPMGLLNVKTGEYQLKYVIHPSHPVLRKLGLGDKIGTIVVNEQGTINVSTDGGAFLVTNGSLTIEQGFFAGTDITYSPKGGNAPPPTEITLWLNLPAISCGVYAGNNTDNRIITGNGVLGIVRSGDAATTIAFRCTTQTYTSTGWNGFWNGSQADGSWVLALINRGIACNQFPGSVTLNVKVRP